MRVGLEWALCFSFYCANKKTGVGAHVNPGQTCCPLFNLSICEQRLDPQNKLVS